MARCTAVFAVPIGAAGGTVYDEKRYCILASIPWIYFIGAFERDFK